MICERCQAEVSDGSSFCEECGMGLSKGKRSMFLVYRRVAIFELYAVAVLLVVFGILYFGNIQAVVLPRKESQVKKVIPKVPKAYDKEVFYSEWAAHPADYKGVPIQKGGLVTEIYRSKGKILGLKVDTVPIGAHGGWTGSVYVICGRGMAEVGTFDIVQVKGVGAGQKEIIVGARGANLPALKADSVEIVSKSESAP